MNSSLISAVRAAKRVFVIGNGGSAANAMHLVNDLLASGVPAFTLDQATMSATANDYGYEFVFSMWLHVVAEPGDLLIAMSGSGKSPNILAAINEAHSLGMSVYRIFGNERGEDMQAAEEAQIAIGHDIMRSLKCKS